MGIFLYFLAINDLGIYADEIRPYHVEGKFLLRTDEFTSTQHSSIGVGGIEVSLGEQKTQSNERGEYRLSHSSHLQQVFLRINKNSLPPGSVLSGPLEYAYHSGSRLFDQRNIHLYYPLKAHDFYFQRPQRLISVELKNHLPYQLSLKNNSLHLNDQAWKKLTTFEQKFDSLNTSFEINEYDREEVEKKLRFLTETFGPANLKYHLTVNFTHETFPELSKQKSLLEADRAELWLIQQGLSPDNIELEYRPEQKENILLVVELKNDHEKAPQIECKVTPQNQEYRAKILTNLMPIHSSYNPQSGEQIIIECPFDRFDLELPILKISSLEKQDDGRFSFELMSPRSQTHLSFKNQLYDLWKKPQITFDLNSTSSDDFILRHESNISLGPAIEPREKREESEVKKVRIYTPLHLRNARNLNQMFYLESTNLPHFYVNGRKFYASENEIIPYLYPGKRGRNELHIFLDDQNRDPLERMPFYMALDPRFYLDFNWSLNQLKNNSSFQNAQYDVSSLQKIHLRTAFFYDDNMGLELTHDRDLVPVELNSVIGQNKIPAKHKELGISFLRRFWVNPDVYNSPMFTLGIGYYHRSFGPDNITRELTPKNLRAFKFSGAFTQKEFLWQPLTFHSRVSFAPSTNFNRNYAFKFTQDLRYNLNDLGNLLSLPGHYNYYQRNLLDRFDFIFRAGVAIYKTDLSQIPEGNMRQNSYWLSLGLGYKY